MPIQKDTDPEKEWRQTLEERLASLETALRAGNTSIDQGQLKVLNGPVKMLASGKNIVSNTGTVFHGTRFTRSNGVPMANFVMQNVTNPGSEGWAYYDQNANNIASDSSTGYGLAKPNIPIPFADDNGISRWPSTASATFTTFQTAYFVQQQPAILFEISAVVGATTNAEVQLTYSSPANPTPAVIFGPQVLTGASNSWFQYLNIPSIYLNQMNSIVRLQLQCRVTNATSTVSASFLCLSGSEAV